VIVAHSHPPCGRRYSDSTKQRRVNPVFFLFPPNLRGWSLRRSDVGVYSFINLVQNLGATSINIRPQRCNRRSGAWSKLFLAIGPEKQYPNCFFNIGGSPKKFAGPKLVNFNIQIGLAQGSRVTVTSNFYKW